MKDNRQVIISEEGRREWQKIIDSMKEFADEQKKEAKIMMRCMIVGVLMLLLVAGIWLYFSL